MLIFLLQDNEVGTMRMVKLVFPFTSFHNHNDSKYLAEIIHPCRRPAM